MRGLRSTGGAIPALSQYPDSLESATLQISAHKAGAPADHSPLPARSLLANLRELPRTRKLERP